MNNQTSPEPYFSFVFYVPEDYAEAVKEAVFNTGAARIGSYDKCAWQTPGTGQFRPLPGSTPFIGSPETVEKVSEVRVEMVCAASCLDAAVSALKKAHPYETPAFMYWPVSGVISIQ